MSLTKKKILQCKTVIKTKLDVENLGWKEKKFYENKSSVVNPFQLVLLLALQVNDCHVKLILTSLFPDRSMMLNAKWSLNERALMHWTGFRKDLKPNVAEFYLIKGPLAFERLTRQFTCHAPVPWNVAKSLTEPPG